MAALPSGCPRTACSLAGLCPVDPTKRHKLCAPSGQALGHGSSGAAASVPSPSSLDIYVQSRAIQDKNRPFDKKQKRIYGRLLSFCKEARGRGCDLLRVDLTTSDEASLRDITADFKSLRRYLERHYGIEIGYFKVQTAEGNGVLHLVLALSRPVYIPQKFLSSLWYRYHASSVVYIQRMGRGTADMRRVSRYLCTQYLADQSALVRISYSWWRCRVALGKGWGFIKKEMRSMGSGTVKLADAVTAWGSLLWCGEGSLGGHTYRILDREVCLII